MEKVSQEAVREITRKLQDAVRSDWEYPQPSVHTAISPSAGEPSEYRERYFGSTDDSDEEEGGQNDHESQESSEGEYQYPYQFDSPDSVGKTVERKLQRGKTRKRKALEEELQYNEGLCFFLHRRNAWTGAMTETEIETQRSLQDQAALNSPHRALSTSSDSSNTTPSSYSLPNASGDNPENTTFTLPATITAYHTDPFQCPPNPESITDVVIPACTPMISHSNPIRASMMSRSHSELYEKVVRDNRSPAIPINLAHMTNVIVQGWKNEGNWPPKNGLPEPPIAMRRDGGGGILVRRMRKETGMVHRYRDGGSVNEGAAAAASDGKGVLGGRGRLKQGVDSVKRVLRLSGGSSNLGKIGKEMRTPPVSPKSPTPSERRSRDGRRSSDLPLV
jgi:hypothetical protein